CSFAETVGAHAVTGHHCHVLQVTLATFVAYGAIVWMVLHQALDHGCAKDHSFWIGNGDACAIGGWRHACHDQLAGRVLLVAELLDRALAARADRSECRVPAEIGNVVTERKTGVEEILLRVGLFRFVVDVNGRHSFLHLFPGTTLFVNMTTEIVAEIFQCALQWLYCSGSEGAESVSWSKEFGLEGERVEILPASCALLHGHEDFLCPRQTAPARRAPAAGFLREEVLEIPDHAYRAC